MTVVSKKQQERLVKQIENVLAIAPMLQEEVSILLRQAREISDALPDARDDIEPPKTRAVVVSAPVSGVSNGNRLYDAMAASKLCGFTGSTIGRLCRQGAGPESEPRVKGGTYRFRKSTLVEWLRGIYIAPEGKDLPRLGSRLLTPSQAGVLMGTPYYQVRILIGSGSLPHLDVHGRHLLFREDCIECVKNAGC